MATKHLTLYSNETNGPKVYVWFKTVTGEQYRKEICKIQFVLRIIAQTAFTKEMDTN